MTLRQRVEFGDWQTPRALVEGVLDTLQREDGRRPACIVEPTCGRGAFLCAAAERWPKARLRGYDINPEYVEAAAAALPRTAKVQVADFFSVDWEKELRRLPEPLLVIGNPPWVTSAALGAIGACNLPRKQNFKKLNGLDARTGKSNFDVSEWMLLRLLAALQGRDATVAMLCKASVARRVIEFAASQSLHVSPIGLWRIDAEAHFSAAVDALLFACRTQRAEAAALASQAKRAGAAERGSHKRRAEAVPLERNTKRAGAAWFATGATRAAPASLERHMELAGAAGEWPVFARLDAAAAEASIGIVDGVLASDVRAFRETQHLAGVCRPEWRSGVKHDCAAVMELSGRNGELVNGFGEVVEIEEALIYPLLKSSDLANGRTARKHVIVPQTVLGQDTAALRSTAPRAWRYLTKHRAMLDARKSSIYRGQPPFALFGVGDYTFAPWKVAISGLYKRLEFCLVGPADGRPTLVDDTCYFLPFQRAAEARTALRALCSELAHAFFEARIFWDAKRPISKALLQSLDLGKLCIAASTAASTTQEAFAF